MTHGPTNKQTDMRVKLPKMVASHISLAGPTTNLLKLVLGRKDDGGFNAASRARRLQSIAIGWRGSVFR